MNGTQVVFIDKDGTLIEDIPWNVNPGLVRLAPGAGQGLRRLQLAGFRIVVVSNQPGVAHGYFRPPDLIAVEERLRELLGDYQVSIDGFYWCPHHPEGKVADFAEHCHCRKPRPGMIFQAALELDIDLQESWMLGDILDDTEAGRRAGCRTILIDNGNETKWEVTPDRLPHWLAPNLSWAARVILAAGPAYRFCRELPAAASVEEPGAWPEGRLEGVKS